MSSTQAGGSSTTEQAKETAQQATQQAKETAQQAGQQARGRVRDEVDRRSTDAGEQVISMADAIRQSAQQLRDQGKGGAAKPIESVASQVERAGSWLRNSDGDRILHDVEDFGRSKPMAVLASSALVGFALSRLLKASSTQRYSERSTDYSGRYGRTAGYGTGTTTGPYGSPGYGGATERERLPESTVPPVGTEAPIGTTGGGLGTPPAGTTGTTGSGTGATTPGGATRGGTGGL